MASSLSASGMGVGFSTLAISTASFCWSMGVITMKIISNTSITSTIGVTLILELILPPSLRTAIAIVGSVPLNLAPVASVFNPLNTYGLPLAEIGGKESFHPPCPTVSRSSRLPRLAPVALLDEVVDEFARRVVHLHVEGLDTSGKVVKRHNRRDSDEQTKSCGHKGFRNTAGDRADTRGLLRRNLLEGVQNADDGSEQSHEGSGRTDGRQNAKASLQLGINDRFSTLKS